LLAELLPRLRSAVAIPVSASVYVRDIAQLERLFAAGLSRAGLALDAASAGVYRRVKGGSLAEARVFLEQAAAAFPGKVSTHLIAGLGETEEEMLSATQWCVDRGVTAGLFAFTPVRGTALALRTPPEMASYRRIQAAAWLIATGRLRVDDLVFDGCGRLARVGLTAAEIARLCSRGLAFRTSGCPGCNRPYYNERPGRIPYNYPRALTPDEQQLAIEPALALASDAGGAPGASPPGPPGPGHGGEGP
jgi:biotin synthase